MLPRRAAVQRGNQLPRSLSTRERQYATNYDGGDADNGRHHTALLRGDLERSDIDFVMALRIWYSAHRDDDDAGNNEKHANPTEWPHDHSANRITYAAALGVSLQGMRRDQGPES